MSGMKSRRKGHDYERQIRREYRELGRANCETSRFASKMMDDRKIDLVNTKPFAVQCKSLINNPSYHKIIDEMRPNKPQYKLIFHKRATNDEYVIMKKNDFYELLEMLIDNNIINPK